MLSIKCNSVQRFYRKQKFTKNTQSPEDNHAGEGPQPVAIPP
jgi:hypothetical protein